MSFISYDSWGYGTWSGCNCLEIRYEPSDNKQELETAHLEHNIWLSIVPSKSSQKEILKYDILANM